MGIAYQASIFDLKYVVQFYFKTDKLKLNEDEFNKKRKCMQTTMFLWSVCVCIYYFCDIYFNYIAQFRKMTNDVHGTDFMIITYYVVGSLYIVLTALIIWHTFALINVIQVMGERLIKEKKRLRILMTVFSISYIGTSAYYII